MNYQYKNCLGYPSFDTKLFTQRATNKITPSFQRLLD